MRALLVAVVVLLGSAPAAAAQDLAPIVDELRDGSVYVAPGVDADADAIREAIADSGERLDVAVLPAGTDTDPRELASQVYERLGGDGTLVVVAGDDETGYRIVAGPSPEAREAASEAAAANPRSVDEAVAGFVERVEGGEEGGFGTGGVILLALAGAGGTAFAINRRRRRREDAVAFAEVKDNVRDDLVVLGEEIRALDLDMQMPDVSGGARIDYETAVNAYDRANRAYETSRRADDLEPVGSALEEGRWAMLATRARLEGREPPERNSPCFFDPRHGPSTREVEWAPPGGAARMVPACEADAVRLEQGEEPHAREVTVGGERMPYWAAGPAYAPLMGGFYGAGILPGLAIGTVLGDAWSEPSGGDFGGGDWGGGDFGGGDFGGGDFGGG
ncbi:MAG TPA: DUF6676 family protein [Solirubrobacteraceae bacterium]|nr:DUF6676 family protein [Solirubrobacteraceae bacterium]